MENSITIYMFYNHQEAEIVKIASTYIIVYKWNNTLTNLSIFNLLRKLEKTYGHMLVFRVFLPL